MQMMPKLIIVFVLSGNAPIHNASGVRGGGWGPGLSVPEIPAPPAAAAGRSPGPPASSAAETAPSDAAPPAAWRETGKTVTASHTRQVQAICNSHCFFYVIHTLVNTHHPLVTCWFYCG